MHAAPADAERSHSLERKLEAGSWGLFFMWVGLGLLLPVGEAIWFLGVAVIVLGTQGLASRWQLKVEGFWVVVGLCFLLGGVWELFDVTVSIVPILMLLVGAILFIGALRPGRGGSH